MTTIEERHRAMPVIEHARIRSSAAASVLKIGEAELLELYHAGRLPGSSRSGSLIFIDLDEARSVLLALGRLRYRSEAYA